MYIHTIWKWLVQSLINKSHSSAKGVTKGALKRGKYECSTGIGRRGGETCRIHVKHESHALPLNGQMEWGGGEKFRFVVMHASNLLIMPVCTHCRDCVCVCVCVCTCAQLDQLRATLPLTPFSALWLLPASASASTSARRRLLLHYIRPLVYCCCCSAWPSISLSLSRPSCSACAALKTIGHIMLPSRTWINKYACICVMYGNFCCRLLSCLCVSFAVRSNIVTDTQRHA